MSSTKRPEWRTRRAWVTRGVRAALATSLVLVAFGLVAVRVSYARATDAGFDFGAQLLQMGEHHMSGDLLTDAYEVQLNGQSIHASSGETPRAVHELLEYFQTQCQSDAPGLAAKFADLDPTLQTLAPTSGVPGSYTIRREQKDSGFVFCIATDHAMKGPEELARLRAVGASWDVGQMGDVRYVFVQRDGARSNVVTAWTRGKFDVRAMFPKTGDAPGEDFGNIPRPDGSRRILTGTVTGAPFGINAYEVAGPPDEVMGAVDKKLVAAGYKVVTMPANVPQVSRFYSLGNVMDVGVTTTSPHSGQTDVSYVVSKSVESVTR